MWKFTWFSTAEAHLAIFQDWNPSWNFLIATSGLILLYLSACLQGSCLKSCLDLSLTHHSVTFSSNFYLCFFFFLPQMHSSWSFHSPVASPSTAQGGEHGKKLNQFYCTCLCLGKKSQPLEWKAPEEQHAQNLIPSSAIPCCVHLTSGFCPLEKLFGLMVDFKSRHLNVKVPVWQPLSCFFRSEFSCRQFKRSFTG